MFSSNRYELKPLSSLFKTSSGGTPLKGRKEYYENGTIPWLTSGEVNVEHITSAKSKITQLALDETSAKIPPVNSVLVSMYGSIGYAGILEFEAAINQAICAIHPNPNYTPEWICHFIRSKKFELVNQGVGGTLTNISQEKIRKLLVPVVPVEEQNKFTNFVKQVDKSKVKFHQLIESYDTLVKSRFVEIFGDPVSNPKGWEKKKLRDLLIIERGGSPRPISAFVTDDENGLNWIKIGDAVEESYYIDHVEEKIKPEGLNKTRQVYPGDLILSNSMSFGKPYILNISGCIHDGWLVLRDSKEVFNKLFLCMALGCPTVTHTFQSMARGAVVKNLNKDLVGNFDMFLPPRKLQDEFVQFIKQVDKSKFEVIYRLQKLKESISPTAPSE